MKNVARVATQKEPSWPALRAWVASLQTAHAQNDGRFSDELILQTLRGGVPEGMVGMEETDRLEDHGPIHWWQALCEYPGAMGGDFY